MFRSVISSGQSALKSSILINGGATVALLAFVGTVWNDPQSAPTLGPLVSVLVLFAVGVLLSAMAHGTTYLSQYFYSMVGERTGAAFHILTVALVLGAYSTFGWATFSIYDALGSRFGTSEAAAQPLKTAAGDVASPSMDAPSSVGRSASP